MIRPRTSWESLDALLASDRGIDYPQSADPVTPPAQDGLRLDDHQAFTPLRPPAQQQDPKQPIKTTQAGATSSAALQHSNLMAQRDRFQKQRGTGSEFAPAPLVAIAMKAGYRQAFETTNEFVWVKF